MLLALTRAVSASIVDCQLTHLARQPIDVARATAEHQAYERLLGELGATVQRVSEAPALPDAVFVEDTAVVFDEIAVIAYPGAVARRAETAAVAACLAGHRPIARIEPPGTLDGGDVLVVDRAVFVGQSTRTNDAAARQLREIMSPRGYRVVTLAVTKCLHLKTAVSRVADGALLLNPDWVDAEAFGGYEVVTVDPAEPQAANALFLGGRVMHPRHFPRTRARLEAAGLSVVPVAMDELAKAEAGITCCSILFGAT
jgi:dimethylargininase